MQNVSCGTTDSRTTAVMLGIYLRYCTFLSLFTVGESERVKREAPGTMEETGRLYIVAVLSHAQTLPQPLETEVCV